MDELYINIKNERLKKGWSQTELAKRVGYSDKSMIAKIEAGKVNLSEKKVKEFADAFGCSAAYLRDTDDFEAFINASSARKNMMKTLYLNKEIECVADAYYNAPDSIKDAVCKLLDVNRSMFNIDRFIKEDNQ